MKIAVIFPGQGSQFVGMGKDLHDNFPEAKAVFDTAGALLDKKFVRACFEGPEELLKDTLYQQVAVFLVSAASWQILKSKRNPSVSFFAGLSLGEYTSLYAAEVLSLQDSLLF